MEFKPEVGQSLRWDFAMQVGRTFSLRTDDVLRLLAMLTTYDKERGEILASERPAPVEPGYFCNKCGYVGPESKHPECNYFAVKIEAAHG